MPLIANFKKYGLIWNWHAKKNYVNGLNIIVE